MDNIYTLLGLVLLGTGLALGLRSRRNRRVLGALLLLLPISPLILARLCADRVVVLIDQALSSCGPLSRAWMWAAEQLASGGRS